MYENAVFNVHAVEVKILEIMALEERRSDGVEEEQEGNTRTHRGNHCFCACGLISALLMKAE